MIDRPLEAAYLSDVQRLGFGKKDTDPPDAEAFLSVARMVIGAIAQGVSVGDVVRGLFDSQARPTFAQARGLVESVIRNLAPQLEYADPRHVQTEPVTVGASLVRMALDATRSYPR